MLVGVMADSHDHLERIDAALALFRDRGVHALIHAGDFVAPFALKRLLAFGGTIHAVFGNNDGERRGLAALMPDLADGPLFVELDDRRILVHHYLNWCRPEDIERADIVITGHTHEAGCRREDGKLFLNPGECCGWVTGRATVALLDTTGPSAEIVALRT